MSNNNKGEMLKLIIKAVEFNEENLLEEINNAEDRLKNKKYKNPRLRDKDISKLNRLKERKKNSDKYISECAKKHFKTSMKVNYQLEEIEKNLSSIFEKVNNYHSLNETQASKIYDLILNLLKNRREIKREYLEKYVWEITDADFYYSYRIRTEKFKNFIIDNELNKLSDIMLYDYVNSDDEFSYYSDIKHYIESSEGHNEISDKEKYIILKELLKAYLDLKNVKEIENNILLKLDNILGA